MPLGKLGVALKALFRRQFIAITLTTTLTSNNFGAVPQLSFNLSIEGDLTLTLGACGVPREMGRVVEHDGPNEYMSVLIKIISRKGVHHYGYSKFAIEN